MADGDALRLLVRYHPTAGGDPRENRPTAAVTALLSESNALASEVARRWLPEGATTPRDTTVRMHRPVGGEIGWVDLELYVRAPRPAIIWVEAKYGSGLSGKNQLEKYVAQIKRYVPGAAKLVLLLVPAQARSSFQQVESLRMRREPSAIKPYLVTWQDLFGTLEDNLKSRHQAHVKWLLKEVLGYMTSEKLALSALKPKYVTALASTEEAQAAAQGVFDRVQELLKDDGWVHSPELDSTQKDHLQSGYWQFGYRSGKRGSKASRIVHPRLAWGVAPPHVFAGVVFHRDGGGPVTPRADGSWHANLLNAEDLPPGACGWLEENDAHRTLLWVTCSRRLLDAATGTSPDEQARGLATFVAAAFTKALDARH